MKYFYLCALLLLLSFPLFSQSLSIDPSGVFAKCPNEWVVYTVTNTSTAACTYNWTVTNGEIQGGFLSGNVSTYTGGNLIQIRWFNVTTSGSVKAVADCNVLSGNGQVTINIPILSINGVNPGTITGTTTATINVTTNQVYEIPQINFPNTGSGDPFPYQVSSYEWEIPSGWTVISGGSTNKITVKPDNCSGGNIRVRGKNTQCTGGPFYTNWSAVKTITRTLPNPEAITGPTSVDCSDVTPVTYQISAVTGATSYTWVIPSGWNGISTTSSITLTPNGLNAGNVTVVANGCGLASAQSTFPITINLFNSGAVPTITGSSPVCYSDKTFTLTNLPPNSTVSWSQSSDLTSVSGQGTINYTVRANSTTTRAYGWVQANIMTPCGPVEPIRNNFWIGKPLLSASYSNGDQVKFTYPGDPVNYNSVTNLVSKTVKMVSTGGPGTWSRVSANPTNADWSASNNNLTFYFFQAGQTATFRYRASNTCGITTQDYSFKSASSGGGGGCNQFTVSPNPSKNILNIAAPLPNIPAPCPSYISSTEEQGQTQKTESSLSIQSIGIYDYEGQLKRFKEFPIDTKTADFDISDLRKGIYIVRITNGTYVETQRIIKE